MRLFDAMCRLFSCVLEELEADWDDVWYGMVMVHLMCVGVCIM